MPRQVYRQNAQKTSFSHLRAILFFDKIRANFILARVLQQRNIPAQMQIKKEKQ